MTDLNTVVTITACVGGIAGFVAGFLAGFNQGRMYEVQRQWDELKDRIAVTSAAWRAQIDAARRLYENR